MWWSLRWKQEKEKEEKREGWKKKSDICKKCCDEKEYEMEIIEEKANACMIINCNINSLSSTALILINVKDEGSACKKAIKASKKGGYK